MKNLFLNSIFSLFLILILVGCQEEIINNDGLEVTIEDDYLVIESEEHMNELLKDSDPYTKLPLKNQSFVSLLDIYQRAVLEDSKYFEKFEDYTSEEFQKLYPNGINPHSDYVNQNSHLFNFHEDGWFELKIANLQVAKIVNSDGIVKVGDTFRRYTSSSLLTSKDKNILKEADPNDSNLISITYEKIRNEQPEARVISSSFQVNECTDRKDRYRVRLYEDILVAYKGNGNYEMAYFFTVHSFRHTVQGWQRRFATSFLAGEVYYEATFGSTSRLISANGQQESIGYTFIESLSFSEFNKPEIYYSQGQAWGRNGCNCTYTGTYY